MEIFIIAHMHTIKKSKLGNRKLDIYCIQCKQVCNQFCSFCIQCVMLFAKKKCTVKWYLIKKLILFDIFFKGIKMSDMKDIIW